MQKITSCLWFDDKAEEAADFYISIFKNSFGTAQGESKIGAISHYDEASAEVSGRPAGSVLTVEFELQGQKFMALNGGPIFKFSEAVSFVIDCADQAEVDYYWDALVAGGIESQCGWLKDKYGLSWQVVPSVLSTLLSDPDPIKANRVMQAMLQMKKIDIAKLEEAYNQ
jgi:predicted 3-demethylubiquinone-9 3-methyltransferase (glyoxalase superfamily)